MRKLADSLIAVGQLKEIDVRFHPTQKGKYEIAAGESRWRAAKPPIMATPRRFC